MLAVAIVSFQFGLHRVVVPLSFLRSISLVSLSTSLNLFSLFCSSLKPLLLVSQYVTKSTTIQ